ncbi:MAG: YraN family protein [Gammaproteobacteria bacterium]|nr:YraN family protein [Gammaproteobacteria bacterium]
MSRQLGAEMEKRACEYLKQQGLKWIESNYTCLFGEIDLIMKEGRELVFIEVRYRRTSTYGSGLESVTYAKQQRVIQTAEIYLQKKKLFDKIGRRFDVVSIGQGSTDILWIRNAFS